MTGLSAYHSAHGGTNFLGLRRTPKGTMEIVYDDGVARRMIWRVATDDPSEARIAEALRVAVGSIRVVPTLYDELKKRAIAIERVAG